MKKAICILVTLVLVLCTACGVIDQELESVPIKEASTEISIKAVSMTNAEETNTRSIHEAKSEPVEEIKEEITDEEVTESESDREEAAMITEPVIEEPVEEIYEEPIDDIEDHEGAPDEKEYEPEDDEYELIGRYDEAVELLACVIYQEAGGDAISDTVRFMAGDVVLNRVMDNRFPDTIYGVLTQQAQFGRYYWTGVVWPDRAYSAGEAHAVQRAYDTAIALLNGEHSDIYGQGYVWMAEFSQGTDVIYIDGIYFGR